MSYHRLTLRLAGLTTAALVLLMATQLLLVSFEVDPVLSRSRLDPLIGWIRDRPRAGPGILLGVALAVLAGWLAWAFAKSFGPARPAITIDDDRGRTRVDIATLEAAIERQVDQVEPRGAVTVRVKRSGRVDATLTTPDVSATGPSRELRDSIDELCLARGLPCRSGRLTVSTPRRERTRVR